EFMSNHTAPCFYHHCADISIAAAIPTACTADAECGDDNACTTDRCDPATHTCEHVDLGPSACDDGNACTWDACSAARGCFTQPMTLADATTGFLGTLDVQPCSTDPVPPAIGALFRKADTFVTRAGATPAKAPRFLHRASKKLRGVAKKLAKTSGRRISSGCAAALGSVLASAQTRVDCLLRGSP